MKSGITLDIRYSLNGIFNPEIVTNHLNITPTFAQSVGDHERNWYKHGEIRTKRSSVPRRISTWQYYLTENIKDLSIDDRLNSILNVFYPHRKFIQDLAGQCAPKLYFTDEHTSAMALGLNFYGKTHICVSIDLSTLVRLSEICEELHIRFFCEYEHLCEEREEEPAEFYADFTDGNIYNPNVRNKIKTDPCEAQNCINLVLENNIYSGHKNNFICHLVGEYVMGFDFYMKCIKRLKMVSDKLFLRLDCLTCKHNQKEGSSEEFVGGFHKPPPLPPALGL